MDSQRRDLLKAGSGLGAFGVLAAAGVITPEVALAEWNKSAFTAKNLKDALAAIGAKDASESGDVTLIAPDIAENGAVVPMKVKSKLANADKVTLLVEKNPVPLAAIFSLPAGTSSEVQTRCKMGKTSDVYALVQAGGKYHMAKKEIKVTIGGCGG